MTNRGTNIDGERSAMEYFYSQQETNAPVVSGKVVLAIAHDHATAYVIDFLLDNGTMAQWQYHSQEERNRDICTISVILNETKTSPR